MTNDVSTSTAGSGSTRFTLAGVLVFGLSFGTVVPAAAACQQWAASSTYSINQQRKIAASPIEYFVQFRLNPGSGQLAGNAEYRPSASRSSPTPAGKGPATGFIRGNRIEITATWGSHSIGVYSGTIDAEGHASGTVHDRVNPSFRMEWHSAVPLYCAVALDVDRPGGDYRNFDLSGPSHDACLAACVGDAKCKAYTYVKPGVQGPSARCWLKETRPYASANNCCVSGVIRGGDPTPSPPAASTPKPLILPTAPVRDLASPASSKPLRLPGGPVRDLASPASKSVMPKRAPLK